MSIESGIEEAFGEVHGTRPCSYCDEALPAYEETIHADCQRLREEEQAFDPALPEDEDEDEDED